MRYALLAFLTALTSLAAEVPKKVAWDQLPGRLKNTLVQVETYDGAQARGCYHGWTPEALEVGTSQGIQKIARADVMAIQVYKEIPARRLRAVGKSYGKRVNRSGELIFNKQRPVSGFVLLGVSTARRAVGLPFAAIGDFFVEVDWSRPHSRLVTD